MHSLKFFRSKTSDTDAHIPESCIASITIFTHLRPVSCFPSSILILLMPEQPSTLGWRHIFWSLFRRRNWRNSWANCCTGKMRKSYSVCLRALKWKNCSQFIRFRILLRINLSSSTIITLYMTNPSFCNPWYCPCAIALFFYSCSHSVFVTVTVSM